MNFAHDIVRYLCYDNLKDIYDLDEKMKSVVDIIKCWNEIN